MATLRSTRLFILPVSSGPPWQDTATLQHGREMKSAQEVGFWILLAPITKAEGHSAASSQAIICEEKNVSGLRDSLGFWLCKAAGASPALTAGADDNFLGGGAQDANKPIASVAPYILLDGRIEIADPPPRPVVAAGANIQQGRAPGVVLEAPNSFLHNRLMVADALLPPSERAGSYLGRRAANTPEASKTPEILLKDGTKVADVAPTSDVTPSDNTQPGKTQGAPVPEASTTLPSPQGTEVYGPPAPLVDQRPTQPGDSASKSPDFPVVSQSYILIPGDPLDGAKLATPNGVSTPLADAPPILLQDGARIGATPTSTGTANVFISEGGRVICDDDCYLVLPHLPSESTLPGICMMSEASYTTSRANCQAFRVEITAEGLLSISRSVSTDGTDTTGMDKGPGPRDYLHVDQTGALSMMTRDDALFLPEGSIGPLQPLDNLHAINIKQSNVYHLMSSGIGARHGKTTIKPSAGGHYNMLYSKNLDNFVWQEIEIADQPEFGNGAVEAGAGGSGQGGDNTMHYALTTSGLTLASLPHSHHRNTNPQHASARKVVHSEYAKEPGICVDAEGEYIRCRR
ncbi:MAG: hypothetical protein M1829_003152 [Trizodia sp. TS-e1964]|nr:MAG: hypothetical protein M1829_003152 [Trizodia sp. TS-e1964]